MKTKPFPRWVGGALAALVLGPATAQNPVTITASDFFNQPGQYFRAYANAPQTTVDVSGLLGEASNQPQAWNFLTGPQEVIYRYDYLPAAEVPESANFPGATLVEQKRDEAGTSRPAWLFFTQDPARGRVVQGFWDPGLDAVELMGIRFRLDPPAGIFNPPLRDFPATISFGDEWTATTVYTNTLTLDDGSGGGEEDPGGTFDLPQQTTYTATARVDAFGVVNCPGIGFGECLRINELVQYDLAADLGNGFEHFGTAYVRNYYWVRPGRGIVVHIASEQSQSGPPPDNFPTASIVLRMFQTNHPDPQPPPPPRITGLTITLGPQGALLTWNKFSGITRYQVEYTTDPAAGPWQALGSPTTANFLIDAAANSPGAPARFYRVVGLP
jgi:hypothetical protein